MRVHLCVLLFLVELMASGLLEQAAAQAPGPAAVTADDEADRRLVAQLLGALEKNPRRGTVLDRVYGLHVERGRLDELIGRYRERIQGGSPDGAAAMIVGLLEAQRGRDAAAVAAFREAQRLRPGDPLAPYFLGQSLLLVGQPAEAALAMERAIARKPSSPNDLLEIYQALGRLHQRGQRAEQALAVWQRLEEQFPDDIRVRERIAAALAEDGQLEPALARYQALAKNANERLKQPLFRIAAADLEARLGRRAAAIADYESLLADLPGDDWLNRDTRRRLEEIFLRNDDRSGLITYYEGQVAKHPDDLDALARLAHHLASLGRVADARRRLEEGLVRAPGKVELRLALIGILVEQQKFADALAHYEQLDRVEPNNPDHLREWGRLILRDSSKPEPERRQAAAAVWRRLLPGPGRRPDVVAAEQVADLFRQAGMVDEALALYRQAVEIAPESANQRIHLGEYLHSLDRRAEALATWKVIAEGPGRDARKLKTLADVLSDFNYRTEAIEALAAARELAPSDLGLVLQLADLHFRAGQTATALKVLEAGARPADDPEQAEQVLSRRIQFEQAAGAIEERAASLEKALAEGRQSGPLPWYHLARYREASRQWPAAAAAIRRAKDGIAAAAPGASQTSIWSSAARIFEGAGQLSEAADALRRLAAVDSKNRSEALRQVARIESKLNHRDAALQAGRDLLAAAPGDAEHYRFFANLCFQLDAPDEGIEVLRRAVRMDPNAPGPLLALAEALATAGGTVEAIELDWRAFDKTEEVGGKRAITSALAALYLSANHFDRLLERLERLRRDRERVPEDRRVFTLCIAQAHQAAGDLGTARRELERLLAERPADVMLLQQLTALAEKEWDLAAALAFQRQLAKVAPRGAQDHLVSLLLQLGEVDEALAIWQREASAAQSTRRLLDLTDNLLFFGQTERALPLIVRVLRDRPQDWEALYREGVALAGSKRLEEAARRFQAILDQERPDDELSVLIAPTAGSGSGSKIRTRDAEDAVFDRLAVEDKIRQEVGLVARDTVRKTFWTPGDFGQARMASLTWLHSLSRRTNSSHDFLAKLRARREAGGPTLRGWWDWFYLHRVLRDHPKVREATRVLVKSGEPPAQRLFLMYLVDPMDSQFLWHETYLTLATRLTPAEVDQVTSSLRILLHHRPDWIDAEILLPAFAALKQARKTHDEETLFAESVSAAIRSKQIVSLMGVAGNRGDANALLQLFTKLDGRSWAATGVNAYPSYQISHAFMAAMDNRAEAGSLGDVARLVDGLLDSSRRRAKAARARSANPPAPGDPIGAQAYYVADHRRTLSMDFPATSDFLDSNALMALGNAFMLYDRVERVEDLIAHVHGRRDKAAPADKAYEHVMLCGFHWWHDERDRALDELRLAADAAPNDPVLRLDLARMHEVFDRPDEALAVIESIPTPDQAALKLRELAALRVAARSGKFDRARLATERLFALRLDPTSGIQVAISMQQIGAREQAAALLDRMRSQAGGRADVLLSLMAQYRAQNRPEGAAEVAHQILRISQPSVSSSPFGFSPFDDLASARAEAIRFLAQSGKLAQMIARAEAQLKATPRSYHLFQALKEYYEAAPDAAKARSALERMLALRLDDPPARLQLANDLSRLGAAPAALEHYLAAIRAQPSLISDTRSQLTYQFQYAGKLADLAAVLDHADLDSSAFSRYAELLSSMIDQPKTRAEGVRLLRSAARKPGYTRGSILQALASDRFGMRPTWQNALAVPELFDVFRDEIVPQPSEPTLATWSGIESYVPAFLAGAAKQNHLSELTEAVERSAAAHPGWSGGKVLLALIDVRRGRLEKARGRLVPLIESKEAPMPSEVRRLLVRELAGAAELHELALRLVDGEDEPKLANGLASYQGSLTRIRVSLLRSLGHLPEARELAKKTFRAVARGRLDENSHETAGRLRSIDAIGRQLLDLDAPVEAMRAYSSTMERKPSEEQPDDFGDGRDWDGVARGLQQALHAVRTADSSILLDNLISEEASDGPGVDLVAFVFPREPDAAALVSVFDDLVSRAASDPRFVEWASARLERARQAHPRDLAVHIGCALVALAGGRDSAAAVERLERLVTETPLDELPPSGRPSSRQQAAAAPQVALWLAARTCLRRDPFRVAGSTLAARALEAARRQDSPASSLAILREWGQIEHDRGDPAAAEARWTEMIGLIDSHSHAKLKSRTAKTAQLVAAPLRPTQAEPRLQLAKMAARQGSAALSLHIVAEAFRNGPPVEPAAGNQSFGPDALRAAEDQFAGRLIELDDLGRDLHMPPDRVYEALRSIVLPESRPSEVFLYAQPITGSSSDDARVVAIGARLHARSLGERLADWAIRAGRADDLRRRTEARVSQPQAELAARVLLVQLALAGKEPKRALAALEGLKARLEKQSDRASARLACHAALPALEPAETAVAATAILQRALNVPIPPIERTVRRRGGSTFTSTGPSKDAGLPVLLRTELARARFQAGDAAGGSKLVRELLAALSNPTNRYSYYRERTTGLRVALLESVAAGQWSDAWDVLGHWIDSNYISFEGDFPTREFERMTAELSGRPPAARYDFIKAWALPNGERKTLRLGGGLKTGDTQAPAEKRLRHELVNSFGVLIDAARDAGQLDALAAAVRPLVEQKIAYAQTLALMVDIARGHPDETAPRLRERVNELVQKAAQIDQSAQAPASYTAPSEFPPAPEQAADSLLALNCLAEPKLREIGAALADRVNWFQDRETTLPGLSSLLRRAAGTYRISLDSGVDAASVTVPGPSLWRPELVAGQSDASSVWVEHEGHLRPMPASEASRLRFAYPLAGTFEFAFEATGSGRVEFGAQSFARPPVPSAPTSRRSPALAPAIKDDGAFHHYRLRVGPDHVRCWIDGRLMHESDDLGRAHPWLTLSADAPSLRTPVFRNLRLSGSPDIPREVNLLESSALRWTLSPSKPLGPKVVVVARSGSIPVYDDDGNIINFEYTPPTLEPPHSTWSLKGGQLVADRLESAGRDPQPTRLDYDRPLHSGDSVHYEFLYEPGGTLVHPTFGRVIFALEPDGVQVHGPAWGDDSWSLSANPDKPAPGRRLGPERPPLKPSGWNKVVLSLRADTITLALNGIAIYERRLDHGDVPRFGLFHFRDRTAVRVRNVILRGEWPQSLTAAQLANLTVRPDGPGSIPERRVRHAWIGESILRQNALHVLNRTRTLPVLQRHEALRAWVMPEDGLGGPRLDGVFQPCDPAPSVAANIPPSSNGVTAAVPAVDLVAAARDAGRLNELEVAFRDAAPTASEMRREQAGLAALIAVAKESDASAAGALARLRSLLDQTKADANATFWPEFVAASAALSRPALQRDASDLLTTLAEALGAKGAQDALSMHIRHVAAIAGSHGPLREPPACEPRLSYWHCPATGIASSRGDGLPRPFWVWREGELRHHPGHAEDALVFASPLRGDFEVSCELSLDDRRSMQVVYGGLLVEIAPDGKSYQVQQDEGPARSFPLEPPLETRGDWHVYRLTVQGGRAEIAVDGRPIHAVRLPDEADPWLWLRQLGRRQGGLRNLRITGNPTIPERLELARGPTLRGWSSSYFGETTGGPTAAWEQQGPEIHGHQVTVAAGRHQESLLQYRRPLFEDGFIEYEFYHGSGRETVHPALDRLVFILTPDGVRTHWLTDAVHDRTELTSDNRADEPACRRGPQRLELRAGAWNRLRITLEGRRAVLQLNGVDIYERELEPRNNRIFGLFHESDETEARVRDVRYQGHWPQRLPDLNQLMANAPPSDH